MTGKLVRRGLVVLGTLVVLAIVAFGPAVVSHFTKASPRAPALASAALRSFPVTATASGTLLPQSVTAVNFTIGGQVAEIDVAVGDTVGKGQQLAKLDASEQQAAVQSAQAQVNAAQTALAAVLASRTSSPTAVASAQSQVAVAQANLQRAQLDAGKTVLSAPQDGTVLEINAQSGDTVNPGTTGTPGIPGTSGTIIDPTALSSSKAFMVIGQGSSFAVFASFNQTSAPQLHTGETGTMTVDALPGDAFPCHITSVASNASLVDGVSLFYAAVVPDQADPRLRSGMTANVIINIAQASDVLAVPSEAVYLLNSVTYVDVWYQGRAVPTHVTTGMVGDQLTQIVTGLSSGQQVVLTTQQALPSSGAAPRATPTP